MSTLQEILHKECWQQTQPDLLAAYKGALYAQHKLNAAVGDGKLDPELAFIAEFMAHPDSTGAYKDIARTMFQRKAAYLTKLLVRMESATANYAVMVLTLVDGSTILVKLVQLELAKLCMPLQQQLRVPQQLNPSP